MGEIEQIGNVARAIGTVDDLNIHPKCIAELRRLAKLRFRDPHGFGLADQTLNFVLEYRDCDFPEKIRALVAAESTFRVLILASGYRHFDIFFAAIAGMLDEIARRFRREIIRRLLLGLFSEAQAEEALRLLNAEGKRGWDVSAEFDEVEDRVIADIDAGRVRPWRQPHQGFTLKLHASKLFNGSF